MISNVPIATISTEEFDAIVFDLDGVVTQTASVHAASWKRLFDDELQRRAEQEGKVFKPFDTDADYRRYVDGKPRYDGVRDFLASRGITLAFGHPSDPPDRETVCGLGNRKNELFLKHLEAEGVEVFLSTVALIVEAREHGFKTAIISSSRNCGAVLNAAGLEELFDVKIDGADLEPRGLVGKPQPDMFLTAASDLRVEPARTVVVEDAISGVEAGRAGNFGLVIGVDRTGHRASLLRHGADIVVKDLEEVMIAAASTSDSLPSALEEFDDIADLLDAAPMAIFLDFDGTLTPIVSTPEQAMLSDDMRNLLGDLSRQCTVALVSGRDRPQLQQLVGLDSVYYIGSHGYDISGPGGFKPEQAIGEAFLPSLDEAERELVKALRDIPGAHVERKKYSIAAHYRLVPDDKIKLFHQRVEKVAKSQSALRTGTGKKVRELQPDMDWHKGSAVMWLLDELGLDEDEAVVMYIGDDDTDENAFKALTGRGITIVVADEPRVTAAQYMLSGVSAVGEFLRKLSGVFTERTS